MAKIKPITAMVVGLGRIGFLYHLRRMAGDPREQNLPADPKFKVTCAVETVPERRREAEEVFGIKTFSSVQQAANARLAELAVICTRSIDHCRHTITCLEAGMHCHVEKPAAMNLAEFDRMRAAARKAGVLLSFNQSLRAHDDVRFIRDVIDSKMLGKVYWIRHEGLGFYRRNDWQQLKKFGGGLFYNGGSHGVDMMLRFADAPIYDVWGDLKHLVAAGDAEDFVVFSIRTKDGRLLEYDASMASALGGDRPRWLVCGTNGAMEIASVENPKTAKMRYFDPKKAPRRVNEGPVPVGRKYRIPEELPWIEKEIPIAPKKPWQEWYDNLYDAIRKGKPLNVPADSVRLTMWTMDRVRRSSQWKR